mgnify:CR=1 FL=1
MLGWIGLTAILMGLCISVIFSLAWKMGADYVMVTKNKARRLNCLEKFFNGLHAFLKA